MGMVKTAPPDNQGHTRLGQAPLVAAPSIPMPDAAQEQAGCRSRGDCAESQGANGDQMQSRCQPGRGPRTVMGVEVDGATVRRHPMPARGGKLKNSCTAK